jgi:hypothetical protein
VLSGTQGMGAPCTVFVAELLLLIARRMRISSELVKDFSARLQIKFALRFVL